MISAIQAPYLKPKKCSKEHFLPRAWRVLMLEIDLRLRCTNHGYIREQINDMISAIQAPP